MVSFNVLEFWDSKSLEEKKSHLWFQLYAIPPWNGFFCQDVSKIVWVSTKKDEVVVLKGRFSRVFFWPFTFWDDCFQSLVNP